MNLRLILGIGRRDFRKKSKSIGKTGKKYEILKGFGCGRAENVHIPMF